MLREVANAETMPGLKFKIVEGGGKTVRRVVQRSNPTASGNCNCDDCLACKGGTQNGGMCRKSNVLYEIACELCPEAEKAVYLGETARNLFTRGKEHQKNYQKKEGESFMKKHQEECHNWVEAVFNAKVKDSFKDCLTRQIAEGVHIRRCENVILNTKSEWHQPALWQVRSELSRE
jgi:hypothetical protein